MKGRITGSVYLNSTPTFHPLQCFNSTQPYPNSNLLSLQLLIIALPTITPTVEGGAMRNTIQKGARHKLLTALPGVSSTRGAAVACYRCSLSLSHCLPHSHYLLVPLGEIV